MTTEMMTAEHRTALQVMESNTSISIVINENIVGVNGYCLAWCEDCSDGINDTRDECDFWVWGHAKKRHGFKK